MTRIFIVEISPINRDIKTFVEISSGKAKFCVSFNPNKYKL